jgi:hypothetical protein
VKDQVNQRKTNKQITPLLTVGFFIIYDVGKLFLKASY